MPLQDDTTTAGHLRDFGELDDQHPAVLADKGGHIARGRDADSGARAGCRAQYLLAGAGLRQRLLAIDEEAAAVIGRDEQFEAGPVGEQRDDVVLVRQVDHQTDRLALAAPAGQLVGGERIEAAVCAKDDQAVGGFGRHRKARPVAFLIFLVGEIDVVSLDGADPALLGTQHSDRLALDQGRDRDLDRDGRRADQSATPAERRIAAELGLRRLDLLGEQAPLPALAGEQFFQLGRFGAESVELFLDLDFFEAAQCAQAHVEDRLDLHLGQLPTPHDLGLWVIRLADDLDDLVEVHINDNKTAQYLHAARHRGKTMPAAALQHLAAVIEKGAQHLLQIHHARHAERVDDIEVERHAQFELGQPEELLHQHVGIDIAVLRLEHDADITGRFVPYVGEERQFAFFEKCGDLFDQPAFLNLIGDLGHDDLIEAVAQLLFVPAGAQAKAAAAGRVSLRDVLRRFDEDPPGRKIGAGHMRDQLGGAAFRLRDQMQ